MPNSGKTTLFNALSRAGAPVASYAFSTKEPNVSVVPVSDPRLDEFGVLTESARIVPATIRFIDIAGLASGASKGEGLGNRFLASIREVDAVVHVVRCFEADDYSGGTGEVDPVRDVELLQTELQLSDIEIMNRELEKSRKAAKKGGKECLDRVASLEKIEEAISSDEICDRESLAAELAVLAPDMGLLTLKPTLIVLNSNESAGGTERLESDMRQWADSRGIPVLSVNALVEAELAELDTEDAALFAEEMGVEEESLARIVRASYDLLGLITFFTVGPDESKAWPIREGTKASQAAGKIHSDLERGFIKAEVVSRDDFVSCKSFTAARDAGTLRLEGRDYVVQDGDVVVFKFAT